VRVLAGRCDRVLVLGSANSSNSQRLAETARAAGAEAVLVSEVAHLDGLPWAAAATVGITSGASTPESFMDEAVLVLRERYGYPEPECLTAVEEDSPVFTLPALPV